MASIRKRTWQTRGSERSAWVVDYFDQGGTRRLKTFKKKKEADAFLVGALHEVSRGTHTPDSVATTIRDAAKDWVERARLDGRERSTVAQYEQHADLHINPRIGDVKLSRFTRPDAEQFRDDLLKAISRPLAKKVLSSLKGILKEAQRRGNVAQNVASGVTIRMDKRHQRKPQIGVDVPSQKEIPLILEHATGRWRPLLVTAIFTGLRASELRGLTWANIDFANKLIHVRQRADKWNEIGSPKSVAGERDMPMPPIVVNTLKEWKLECKEGELDLVFPNGAGNVEALANIWQRGFGPVQVAAGIATDTGKTDKNGEPVLKPKYGMHALRHFYASWLIGQGFKPKRVQQLMGHSSIQMTFDVYGHWFPSEEDDHERLAAGQIALVG